MPADFSKELLAFYYALAEFQVPKSIRVCNTSKEFSQEVKKVSLRGHKHIHQTLLAAYRRKVLIDLNNQITDRQLIQKYHRLFNGKYRNKFVQLKSNRHLIRKLIINESASLDITTFVLNDDTFLLTVFESVFIDFLSEFSSLYSIGGMVGLYVELAKSRSAFLSFLTHDEAILLRWPDKFHITQDGIFHSAVEPSITWGNERFYFYNNLPIPSVFFESPELVTKSMVMAEKNVEKRRAYMEILGSKRFAELLDLRIRDQAIDRQGSLVELYQSNQPDDLSGDYIQFVKVICPSTGRSYMLCVPPEINGALEAVAWTFGKKPEDYRPIIET